MEKKEFQINKIDFITSDGERISIDPATIAKIFKIVEYNSIREIISMPWKGMNKIKLSKILFMGGIRKLRNIEPRISGEMCLPLISPFIAPLDKLKKIIKIEVHLNDVVFHLSLRNSPLFENLTCIKQVIYYNQYNLSEKNVKNKIIIDAGSYLGEFSLLAVYLGAKKVYAFEPVSDAANALTENIKLNNMQNKISVVKMALGDKNCFEPIYFAGKSERVEFVKLDSFVSDNNIKRIDFIKSDVEGFEDKLLMGATSILEKFKPVLSMAAYHKGCGKEKLSKIIKSVREDYNIIINNFDEEDLYCW